MYLMCTTFENVVWIGEIYENYMLKSNVDILSLDWQTTIGQYPNLKVQTNPVNSYVAVTCSNFFNGLWFW